MVLVLGAYDPSIWRVKASTATRIVGVWLSGYHEAQITGLSADTPILRSSHKQNEACRGFTSRSAGKEREVAGRSSGP